MDKRYKDVRFTRISAIIQTALTLQWLTGFSDVYLGDSKRCCEVSATKLSQKAVGQFGGCVNGGFNVAVASAAPQPQHSEATSSTGNCSVEAGGW